jgi:hypothetical protein
MSIAPALWGLLGAACIEGIEFTKAIKNTKGWPWRDPQEPDLAPYLTAIAMRLAASTGYAQFLVMANGGASSGIAGFVAGLTAPLAIEALARQGTGSWSRPAVGGDSAGQKSLPSGGKTP